MSFTNLLSTLDQYSQSFLVCSTEEQRSRGHALELESSGTKIMMIRPNVEVMQWKKQRYKIYYISLKMNFKGWFFYTFPMGFNLAA